MNITQPNPKNKTMKTMKQVSALMLVVVAIGATSRAQTTNYVVNEFNTAAEVTNSTALYDSNNGWANWFGGAFQSVSFDPTSDSTHNPASGSMETVCTYSLNDYGQFTLFDGFYTMSINAMQFTNLSFDVRFAADSCVRTNSNSQDFGLFQVGDSDGYGQDYFSSFAIPVTNSLGLPNTNWVHVSLALNPLSDTNLTNITGLVFHSINTYYGNTYSGTQTFWLDNIVFTGSSVVSTNPPPVVHIQAAKPGLRIFAGGTITYGRDELATADQQQSWIGASGPVSYSFTLLDYNPNIAQIHNFLIPVKSAGTSMYNNIYVDYNASNMVWLVINPLAGTNEVTASVQWKTNLSGANPDQTALIITNQLAVGTWTLTFNNSTNGTLTAPGAGPVAFTIADPNAVADFGNPLVAYFGLQPNTGAGIGQYIDYGSMAVSGVAGVNENDTFTTDSTLDTSVWQNSGFDTILATTNTPLWVYYDYPAYGYGLGTSDNLTGSTVAPWPWVLPEYYNGYADGPNIPGTSEEGQIYTWTLVPSTCLPTSNGNPGGALSPTGFFQLFNPPLQN